MKAKPIFQWILFLLILWGCVTTASAQYIFSTNIDGSLTITRYTGQAGIFTIPASTNGMPITAIGDSAFSATGSTYMTNVTMPNSISNIGNSAFNGCSRLKNVTLSANLTNIGDSAFLGCIALNPVVFPNSLVTLGKHAFDGCWFSSINIPTNVVSIGDWAFANCSYIKNVVIPLSVTDIGIGPFYYCVNLTNISVNPSNSNYVCPDGALYDKAQTMLIQLPSGKAPTNFIVPDSVITIASGACYRTHISSVKLGNAVVQIGTNAISSCTGLTNVLFSNNISDIRDSAFAGDTGLAFITIPNSVTNLGAGAFSSCSGLLKATLGSGITRIEGSTFSTCASLTNVTINGPLLNIGALAFYNCTALSKVSVPDTVTNIEYRAFGFCYKLSSVNIPKSLIALGADAFVSDWKLSGAFNFPDSLLTIGQTAFGWCTNVTSVSFGQSLTSFGNGAFYACSRLSSLYFRGDAPSDGGGALSIVGSPNAKIYYLPSRAGWDLTYDGVPTVPFSPQILVDSNFGMQSKKFGFNVVATNSVPVVIKACTNISQQVWVSVTSFSLNNNTVYFSDSQTTNNPARFYSLDMP